MLSWRNPGERQAFARHHCTPRLARLPVNAHTHDNFGFGACMYSLNYEIGEDENNTKAMHNWYYCAGGDARSGRRHQMGQTLAIMGSMSQIITLRSLEPASGDICITGP